MRRFAAKTLVVLTSYAVLLVNISAGNKANLTDVRKCRVTHAGTEYTGPISKTALGILCQFWDKKYTTPEISQSIEDKLFPDGSKSLAKNWCRNPGGQQDEPWCYTRKKKLIEEYCDVPLCIYHECRLTGPGVEYAGKVQRSSSERECRPWTDRHKDVGAKNADLFPNGAFPERSRRNAKRRCRNPDGDPGGPWCYVEVPGDEYWEEEKSDDEKHEKGAKKLKGFEEEENEEEEDEERFEREYCDVPFCDEKDCMVYTTGGAGPVVHSHWTSLGHTHRNISLAVKLWRPEEWHRVRLYLALSVLAVPSNESQIQEWQAGVELTLSNTKSGIVAGGENETLVSTPGLIWGTRWTQIWIRWGEGYISMGKENNSTPLISEEYRDKAGLLGLNPGAFNYYSISGEGGMWSFPFCDTGCDVQTTTQLDFVRFWPLKKMAKTHEATFFVRAGHSACVELRVSPAVKYPHIWLMMSGKKNLTQLILQRTASSRKVVMQSVKADTLLSYWKWEELSISVFGDSLSVFWTRDIGTHTLIEAGHEVVRRMRWVSPGSLSTAHWTMFCDPTEEAQVPAAVPPECLISETEVKYMGSQWTTMMGQPCLPWLYVTSIVNSLRNDQLFQDGSVIAALNYCRNPTRDPQGPFCFVQNKATNVIRQEYCHPRKCRAAECRIAGTGNDYIGQLNVTRSKRTCQKWVENTPHLVNADYRNETLFPDRTVEEARNYCRDPSRNIAGSWCYTVDPKVPQDVCDVRDCVKPEECTMMTRGDGEGRLIYIRNKWKKEGLKFWLKEWDPDLPDGIIFVVRPLNGDNYYKLIIGAEENEKVQLFHGEGKGKAEVLLKEKTLPHLIPIGKWGGFWLRIPTGRISLGYEGLDNHLFDWEHSNVSPTEGQRHEIFKPMFITFTSVKGYTIGVNFPCDECHTEKTSTKRFTKILPLGLWSKERGSHNSLTLHIRGTGVAAIPLIKLPGLGQYYGLRIGDVGNRMYYIKQEGKNFTTLTATKISGPMIYTDKWTVFHISYNETNFSVKRNGERLLRWKHNEPMLFYWFSLGAENGEITWSANCDPEEIDGDPRNGGWSEWSPWTCSVTCGGGEGISTRTCTNPVPNVYGEYCIGDDKIEGDCNNFKCGEISPDTMEYLRDLLRKHHQSIQSLQGDQVELICHQEALSKIQAEAPTSKIKWALNGVTIIPDGMTVIIKNNSNLVISSAEPRDSGVYTCIVFQESGSRSIISVASLAVKPQTPTISTRETRHITLNCHSEVLGYIYRDLTLKWEVNGKLWKDYGLTTLAAVNIEELQHVKYSHAGEWKCIIQQPDLNFEWVTNWILVEVKHAPNFLTYLMEDPLPAHFFKHFEDESLVLAFLIGLLLLTIVVVAAGTYVYMRWCRLQ